MFDPLRLALMRDNAPGPRLWSYSSFDTPVAIKADDYFLPAAKLLRVGDVIFAHGTDNAPTALTVDLEILIVLTCTAAGVSTALKSA